MHNKLHKSQTPSQESQNAPFNKSLNEATSSMTHLSTSARHEATVVGSEKNSDEKRIEVRIFNSAMDHSIGNAGSITRSTSVITSSSSQSSSSFSNKNDAEDNNNTFGN